MNHTATMKCFCLLPLLVSLAGAAWTGRAQASQPVPPAIRDTLSPAPPAAMTFRGRLGLALDQCVQNRLLAQPIEPLVIPFREKKETGSDGWRCEYWGKWYTSLCLADAWRPTPETGAKRDDALQALLATAAPDGYLGTRLPEHRLKGWDVWGRKYALLGLLTACDRTGHPATLEAARRHLDTLMAETGPGRTNLADLGEHKGLAASSILEPTVLLYQRTGERKYLDFAQYIVGQWSLPSNHRPQCTNGLRLIEDSLAGVSPENMRWNKAYEMMSCFEGLCELYRVTGDRRYLDVPIRHAQGIFTHETTLVGPGTQIEHWFSGRLRQTTPVDRPMETCVTATWMKFLYQLHRLTGDPRYADELEKNLYNGLLGAMMPEGRWWAYFSGLMGERVPSDMQHEDVGLSCCVVSGPRALMLTPFWATMTGADGPTVNLCAPGQARLTTPQGRPITLDITGDYPMADTATLALQLAQPESFTLSVRIPAWSSQTRLTINGKTMPVQAGAYARLKRTWKNGDRIVVQFDFRGRILDAPDGNGQIALARGPLVLSLDSRLAPPQAGTHATLDRSQHPFVTLKPNAEAAQKAGAWVAFDVPFDLNGQPGALTFCNFASAGNEWREGNFYRTWLPQPLDLGKAYHTGQTWQTLTHRPFRPTPPPTP